MLSDIEIYDTNLLRLDEDDDFINTSVNRPLPGKKIIPVNNYVREQTFCMYFNFNLKYFY